MIQSMTGFGRSQTVFNGIDLSVEISSVNRRNLEISVSIPREWQSLERDIQSILRNGMNRGKLYVQIIAVPTAGEAGFHWNAQGLESSIRRLAKAATDNGIQWEPSSDALVRLAALNKVEMVLPGIDEIKTTILEVVGLASEKLIEMRSAEGDALKTDLKERLEALSSGLVNVAENAGGTVDRYREVLLQRLRQFFRLLLVSLCCQAVECLHGFLFCPRLSG
jgi:uncharacterized protein (TIGR00255 family)